MNIDTERVIVEVQLHPVIWDTSLELYKSRDARQAAWLEICKNVVDDFDELDTTEKKAIEQKLQQRWKTARDCYVKARTHKKNTKSTSGAKKSLNKRLYIHYDMMTFLDANVEEPLDSQVEAVASTQEEKNDRLSQPSTSAESTIRDEEDYIHSSSATTASEVVKIQKKTKKRKKTETDFQKELLSCIKKSCDDLKDEDWAFFYSILPTVKKLNTYQKLMFRSKILNFLIQIEREDVYDLELTDV